LGPALAIAFLAWFIYVYFCKRKDSLFFLYRPKLEEIQENINLLKEDIRSRESALTVLPQKAENIASLSQIVDRFTRMVDQEKIYDYLLTQLSKMFDNSDNVLLFMFNRTQNILDLVYSCKKGKVVIKEKHGDFMEWWVLRNNQSLLIEDFSQDFRFNAAISPAYQDRRMQSLMINPISLGDEVIGVVRIESMQKKAFSLDDMRMLRILCDVTAAVLERAQIFNKVEELATRDALTDLFLRDVFMYRLKEELTRAKMMNTELALGVLDIDDFKQINDTYGHTVGDLALKRTAAVLTRIAGDSGNVVARYGGEEFVFFLVRSNKDKAKKIAESVREEIGKVIIRFRRKRINFTASLGLAFFPQDGDNFLKLMEKADGALYRAKKEGKNRVCSTD